MDILSETQQDYSEEQFARLSLTGQTVTGKTFEKCTFDKCSFVECRFDHCTFVDCMFTASMVSAIDVKTATFLETTLQDSKIMGMEWSKAAKVRGLRFEKCDLQLCGFSFLKLKHFVLKDSKAVECNFMESDCTDADFSGTDLDKCIFQRTNLTSANFRKAFNYAIDFKNNTLKKTKFSLPEASSLLGGLDIVLER